MEADTKLDAAEPDAPDELDAAPSVPTKVDAPKPTKKKRRALRIVGRIAMGLAVGVMLAEVGFRIRDHGAFPHLNVYEADPELAVRLRPGASQALAIGKNPITHVRIDAQGFRGADLPAPAGGEIVVVGDSQVFGLGVEENETASARLGAITGVTVINAGVPTYGPLEYNKVTARLLETYSPAVVVYVVNFANDLFEASHPNLERHGVWDGWAVRRETLPEAITDFPGRALLYRDSHAFFALRSLLYRSSDKLDDRGFASEGTVPDLVVDAKRDHEDAEAKTKANEEARDGEIAALDARRGEAEDEVEEAALDALDLRGYELGAAYQESRNNPGDIVITTQIFGEESRGPPTTAREVWNGAKLRKAMEAQIKKLVEGAPFERAHGPYDSNWDPEDPAPEPYGPPSREVVEGRKRLARSYKQREALGKRLADLKATPAEIVRAWSPMTPILREVKDACDARGSKLLVVALPLDVQVSKDEWAKYGVSEPPVDMDDAQILVDDLVASAEAIGAEALDATPALRDAEPGAFLDGDIHMTPKGQAAFAEAIAKRLRGD